MSQYLPTPMLSIQDLTETAYHCEKVDPFHMSKIILVTPLTSKQHTYISLICPGQMYSRSMGEKIF